MSAIRWTRAWPLVIAALLLLRIPSLAQPMGGDQGLYVYAGQRVLDGSVPYRDVWDQKPPGLMFLYAALWTVWPRESVVAAADLGAAALTSLLLVFIGRRLFGLLAGVLAASAYLMWSDPSLGALGGLYLRGQGEIFISLAVTAAVFFTCGAGLKPRGYGSFAKLRPDDTALSASPDPQHGGRPVSVVAAGLQPAGRPMSVVAAGLQPGGQALCLGVAVWVKYNAIVYLLPVAVMMWASGRSGRQLARDLGIVVAGLAVLSALVLGYFAANGALGDLKLATIDYNVRYSGETYSGPLSVLSYLVTLPLARMRVDMLWFLGGIGVLAVVARSRTRESAVVLAWIVAAALSIAVNGARELPQYFIQAAPPLALAAGAGLAALRGAPRFAQIASAAALVLGLWKVGIEPPSALGARWGGLPKIIERARADYAALTGTVDRTTYLARFRGRKHDAPAIDQLARHARETTNESDRLFVFGFSGGVVNALAHRASASRFFWSRPVIIEFAADHPGYGSAGLLEDLENAPPTLVALQQRDWNSAVDPIPDSASFFMTHTGLRAWLDAHYEADRDVPGFLVFRRRP